MTLSCALRKRRLYLLVLLPVVLGLVLSGAATAHAITRNEVLSRAQVRVDKPVAYSQSRYYAGYRTDCSGYVSMTWRTGISWSTRSLHVTSHRITKSQLKPGDALNKPGYHVRLFYGWLDEAKTQYVAYEATGGKVAGARIHSYADDISAGYRPIRRDRITDSPASRNILKNPGFDTWVRSWSVSADQPVWWQVTGPAGKAVATRRRDTYRTARNSLRLGNTSTAPSVRTGLSQTVRVVPDADYRLTAYARSTVASSAIELRLRYLDRYGATLAEASTTGDRARIVGTSYRPMSVPLKAPPGTVRARVSISLAGGGHTNSSGTFVPGTCVYLDDVSLARPRLTVGIKTSTTSARNGTRIVLEGPVRPKAAVGAPAHVYVRRPGGSWTRFATKTVTTSGSAGAWSAGYTFKKGMPRGTYRFRTTVPAVPGYLGCTSKTVAVTLR